MKKPKTQKQQALWYLINWKSFSLKDIINDSMFYKFQTRLSELESEFGSLAEKSKKEFINRFGRKSKYVIYSCSDQEKAKEVYLKLQE